MTDIERLIFLEAALRYRGVALGEDGWDWGTSKHELTLLPHAAFEALEKERRALLRRLSD